mmetsp:Transcript_78874/g.109584  ORF Transcript_78874/g.109584 Transcript_78874/m.109584 type:complete len:340 (+) Transcript_78874:57-1076(+)
MSVQRFLPRAFPLRSCAPLLARAYTAAAGQPPSPAQFPVTHEFFVPAWQRATSQKRRRKSQLQQQLDVHPLPSTVSTDLSELCYLSERSWDEPLVGMMVHGLMGCAANWKSVMRRVCNEYTAATKRPIEIIMVDLRNHGDSTLQQSPHGLNTVSQCATDLVSLFDNMMELPLPNFVIGHSFGGKVALEFSRQALLPPQKVICLDTCPSAVADHSHSSALPSIPDLLKILKHVPNPLPSQQYLYQVLRHKHELSEGFARWMVANLRYNSDREEDGMSFKFKMDPVAELFASYQEYCAWDVLESPPSGTSVDWVCAEKSPRWCVPPSLRCECLLTFAGPPL